MVKVFISQPMNGKTKEEILAERGEAILSIKSYYPNDEVEVLDTYFKDYNGKPLEYIGKSIMMLAQADVAYFCKGWDKARGCKIEHLCAKEYGVKTLVSTMS